MELGKRGRRKLSCLLFLSPTSESLAESRNFLQWQKLNRESEVPIRDCGETISQKAYHCSQSSVRTIIVSLFL